MTHPSDAELDRYRGAADPETGRRVREHLAGCEDCARRLAELEREERRTEGLLRLLDGERPKVDAEEVILRARRRDTRRFALAAGVAGLLVAGAAAATVIPGSPLREWLDEIRGVRPVVETPQPAAEPGSETPPALPGPGVQLVPAGSLEIDFAPASGPGTLRVAWSATSELTLYAVEGTADFSVGPDRVGVDDWGAGARFELRVPRGLAALRVTADGAVLLELVGGEVTLPPGLDAAALDEGRQWAIPAASGSGRRPAGLALP